jgi:alkylation response protein AidB-like acyl-CoA dehydrogenase
MHLLALSDSCTDEVKLCDLRVTSERVLHGPVANVLAVSQSTGAGGLQTSALALGLAACAINWIHGQTHQRGNLSPFYESLENQWMSLFELLNQLASGIDCKVDAMTLRKDSNTLVLRATQSALAISKGAGFLAHNSIARWTREAMFFLVWSCPQGVAEAHLCEFTQFAPIP